MHKLWPPPRALAPPSQPIADPGNKDSVFSAAAADTSHAIMAGELRLSRPAVSANVSRHSPRQPGARCHGAGDCWGGPQRLPYTGRRIPKEAASP
mmetsp:Transcript_19414/g.44166  ORF Transcript_19414/g.44166 Transcript_19414/m.44166 type:complete len:95 (+) Transcript_19414:323-607(+)